MTQDETAIRYKVTLKLIKVLLDRTKPTFLPTYVNPLGGKTGPTPSLTSRVFVGAHTKLLIYRITCHFQTCCQ